LPAAGVVPDIREVVLSSDLYSICSLLKNGFGFTASSLLIVGEAVLTTITLTSESEITLSNAALADPRLLQAKIDLSTLTSTLSIQSEYGVSLNQMLRVELPESVICSLETLPPVTLDVSAIQGPNAYVLFPTSRWVGSLANISTKFTIENLRHAIFTESSKHMDVYDGLPPYIRTVGSGDYYRNGVKVVWNVLAPTNTPTPHPFGSIKHPDLAIILVGVFGSLAVVVGVIIYFVRKRRVQKSSKTDDETRNDGELTMDDIRQSM
jgi:hypothetical protein